MELPEGCSAASFNSPSDRWHVYPVLLLLTSPHVKTRWHCPPCNLQKIRSLLQDFHWLVLQLDCFHGDAAKHVELLLGHRLHQLPQHHHCVTWPVCVLVTFLASPQCSLSMDIHGSTRAYPCSSLRCGSSACWQAGLWFFELIQATGVRVADRFGEAPGLGSSILTSCRCGRWSTTK